MNKTRPVAIYKIEFKNGKLKQETLIEKATFHMFSTESSEDGSYPVAVVEREDGSVTVVDAHQIKFLDKEHSCAEDIIITVGNTIQHHSV